MRNSMTQQRRFTKEFAEEAVRLVQTSGRTKREMAGDLGIGLSTLVRWIGRSRDRHVRLKLGQRFIADPDRSKSAERITEAETRLPSRGYAGNRRSDLPAGRFGSHAACGLPRFGYAAP